LKYGLKIAVSVILFFIVAVAATIAGNIVITGIESIWK